VAETAAPLNFKDAKVKVCIGEDPYVKIDGTKPIEITEAEFRQTEGSPREYYVNTDELYNEDIPVYDQNHQQIGTAKRQQVLNQVGGKLRGHRVMNVVTGQRPLDTLTATAGTLRMVEAMLGRHLEVDLEAFKGFANQTTPGRAVFEYALKTPGLSEDDREFLESGVLLYKEKSAKEAKEREWAKLKEDIRQLPDADRRKKEEALHKIGEEIKDKEESMMAIEQRIAGFRQIEQVAEMLMTEVEKAKVEKAQTAPDDEEAVREAEEIRNSHRLEAVQLFHTRINKDALKSLDRARDRLAHRFSVDEDVREAATVSGTMKIMRKKVLEMIDFVVGLFETQFGKS
jgi:hypothetical protein